MSTLAEPQQAPEGIRDAIHALWARGKSSDVRIGSGTEFSRLKAACLLACPGLSKGLQLDLALQFALRSLAMPGLTSTNSNNAAIDAEQAATILHNALLSRSETTTFLCPLDLADDLPTLQFENWSIRRYQPDELAELFGRQNLLRHQRAELLPSFYDLARWQWLVVRDTNVVEHASGPPSIARILASVDSGACNPHLEKLPAPIEKTLFFMLLAPWEDWVEESLGWRPFLLPWMYRPARSIFEVPAVPKSAQTLSWQPCYGVAADGSEYEDESPITIPVYPEGAGFPDWFNESRWRNVQTALCSVLFQGPVLHFFVRAYHEDGIDEFMAHIMAIEAALGTRSDHLPSVKSKEAGRLRSATGRVVARVEALLGCKADGALYAQLYQLRSTYIHGDQMRELVHDDRRAARRLARRVVLKLSELALTISATESRDAVLENLMRRPK